MKNDKKNTEHTKSEKGSYMVFYVLSVVLLAFMVFSMLTSYQSFVQYCDNYVISPSDVWSTGFQSILAAAVPCLVYAATLYGIGYLIQHKN